MDEQEREHQIARLWPRLREEAHDLYREVGVLRGRVKQLEGELAALQRSAESARETNAKLTASLDTARARLRAIESSRGWRLTMRVRRILRRSRGPAPKPTGTAPVPSPRAAAASRESTFSQRRTAEAMRRAEVAAELRSWTEGARAATSDLVIGLAGDRSAPLTEAMIRAAEAAGDPVCVLEADPERRIGGIPPGVKPSLVPDLLAMDAAGKDRLLICTTAHHEAIRWVVPAQQKGWWTVLVAADAEPSAALRYLASVVDAVVVPNDAVARAFEVATGVHPIVRENAAPRDLLSVSRAAARAVTREVLGID